MRELGRSYHKKRKWVCPRCGRARMQAAGEKRADRRRKENCDGH
ncbi:MAG: hypothetical protein ACYTGB_07265 [Planctomycetota bacterium]|jgi:hypothetical protein